MTSTQMKNSDELRKSVSFNGLQRRERKKYIYPQFFFFDDKLLFDRAFFIQLSTFPLLLFKTFKKNGNRCFCPHFMAA